MASTVPTPNRYRLALKKACERFLVALTPREEMILRLHFGIGRQSCYTFQELGKQFSRTPRRIRQIRAEAMRKLRQTSRYLDTLDSAFSEETDY